MLAMLPELTAGSWSLSDWCFSERLTKKLIFQDSLNHSLSSYDKCCDTPWLNCFYFAFIVICLLATASIISSESLAVSFGKSLLFSLIVLRKGSVCSGQSGGMALCRVGQLKLL